MNPLDSSIQGHEFNRINKAYTNFFKQIEEMNELLDYASKVTSDNFRIVWSASSKSAIIMSSGFLQRYLRDSFMEFIEVINETNIDIKYVRKDVLKTNKIKTLELLKLISNGNYDANYEQVVLLYATSFNGNSYKPILVKETFSLANANPGKETIQGLFQNIGVRNVFDHDVFKNLNYIGGVVNKLEEFIGFRNSFAHGGSGTSIPSLDDTQDMIEFLKIFVYSLNKILDEEIMNIETKFHRDYFYTLPRVYIV